MRRLRGLFFAAVALCPGLSAGAPPPDLSVESFAVAIENTTVTFTAEICNLMVKTPAPACSVGLFFDLGSEPVCFDAADVIWQLPVLAASQCEILSHTRDATPLGEYTAWVLADWGCAVVESGETNNLASAFYSVVPKLEISSLTAAAAGDGVAYEVRARNQDVDAPGPLALALYFDRAAPPGCGDPPDQLWPLASLPAGVEVVRSFNRTAVATGAYTAWAFVDQGCVVDENTEDDNVVAASYLVGPNLWQAQARVQPSWPAVTYSVDVCNNGSAPVAQAEVALWYDLPAAPACSTGAADHSWSVSALAPGACVPLTHARDNVAAGSYAARFFADAACAVDEARETDNVASVTHTVQGPDLWIQQLNVQTDGSTVTLFADICNAGTSSSAGFDVGFYFDASGPPDCQSVPSAVQTAGGLDPTICHTLTATRSDLNAGAKQAWAFADQGCVIPENDETNNTASSDYAIIARPDLRITKLSAEADGDTVRLSATVCNSATAAAAAPSSTGLFFGRADAPPVDCSAEADLLAPLPQIAPGDCADQSWTRTAVPPGQHGVHALADALCAVDEEDETNNAAQAIYEVPPPPTPDGGLADAGAGGPADGGPRDTAEADTATDGPSAGPADSGCACRLGRGSPANATWTLGLLLLLRRRRRLPRQDAAKVPCP